MSIIPIKQRNEMAANVFYHSCAREAALHDHICKRDPMNPYKVVEWEHSLTAKGRKVQDRYAIIPLCWWVHRGPGMVKEVNVWIALNRASEAQIQALTALGGVNYVQYKKYLDGKYGVYKVVENPGDIIGIAYGYPGESQWDLVPGRIYPKLIHRLRTASFGIHEEAARLNEMFTVSTPLIIRIGP